MLEVKNLRVNYGESEIIGGVDLVVPSGRVVCLMGRNGVGKTTMLKALMGTLKVRTGSILFDGADMTTMPPHQRARAGIGYVPQGRGIFPYLTVFENLCMGFESVPGARIDPDGIDRMYATFPILKQMSRRVAGTLSGGQQQQLAIARALVRRPRLLLLDEPTAGMNPTETREILEFVRMLRGRGMTILLIEHKLSLVMELSDRVVVMDDGRKIAEGSPAAVRTDARVIEAYLGAKAHGRTASRNALSGSDAVVGAGAGI